MNDSPLLEAHWSGASLRLRLNRPSHGNALSPALVDALMAALADAAARGVTVLALEGSGKHFCTGFDLSSLDRETDASLLARFVRVELLLQAVARAPFTTVALGRGRIMGAGADLFAACDVRLATGPCTFAFPGFSGFGIVLGSRRLAARVGAEVAQDWITSGRGVGLDEAAARGFVHEVVEDAPTLDDLAARHRQTRSLDPALRAALHGERADDARDLDALVRSAAAPGLRDRIAAYADAATRRARKDTFTNPTPGDTACQVS